MLEDLGRGRPTILLIDDDPTVLALATRTLREDFTVITATNGPDGYALLGEFRPDLVVLDIMMPVMDGWRVLQQIRSDRAVSQTPVIVMTGLGPEAAQHEARELAISHVLYKPILPSRLLQAVRDVLQWPG